MENKNYKKLAKKLRKFGFLDIDLRKPLSSKTKSLITRRANKYSSLLNSPSRWVKRRVGDESLKAFKRANRNVESKTQNYIIVGNKVFIPKNGFEKVKVTRKLGEIAIERETASKKNINSQYTLLTSPKRTLELLSDPRFYNNPNILIAVSTGANDATAQAFASPEQLLEYLNNTTFLPITSVSINFVRQN